MDAIKTSSRRNSPREAKARVDLTPMVDLAFLLITFFMLTTALVKPQVMPLVMPEKDQPELPDFRKESQVLTLLLGSKNQIYFYEGITHPELDSTSYAAEGLRRIILEKKKRVDAQWPPSEKPDPKHPGTLKSVSKLTILIKPTREASYKNVVDALDEMNICHVAYYVLMDISEQELAFILNPGAGLSFDSKQQAAAR
ncbi:MAG: biopolymer transporter ExbD [Lewinellaceae bacterium]|nr:biopolymer transporter ExbD [Saprospiraceae bacterium]MCB9332999.1 biopolymer transporter ExbD [Lewinellaceae bacterium]